MNNGHEVMRAIELFAIAIPFMFGVLAIFAALTLGLTKIGAPSKNAH